jgi:hypothetical protein
MGYSRNRLHQVVGFVVERFARLKLSMEYRVRAPFIAAAVLALWPSWSREIANAVGYPFPRKISPVVAIRGDKIALDSPSSPDAS